MKTSRLISLVIRAMVELAQNGFSTVEKTRAQAIKLAIRLYKGEVPGYSVRQFFIDNSCNLNWNKETLQEVADGLGLVVREIYGGYDLGPEPVASSLISLAGSKAMRACNTCGDTQDNWGEWLL